MKANTEDKDLYYKKSKRQYIYKQYFALCKTNMTEKYVASSMNDFSKYPNVLFLSTELRGEQKVRCKKITTDKGTEDGESVKKKQSRICFKVLL